jgi:hypothetical protein
MKGAYMKYFSKAKSIEEAKILYKKLALENHPDKGGETSTMQEINAEFELAFSFLKHKAPIIEKEDTADNFTKHFYTQNGWEGSRYNSNLSKKDIAKIMREYVKNVYPTWKFSIRMDGYNSIHISVMEAPIDLFTSEGREGLYNGKAHEQINHYYIDGDSRITDYCKMVLKDIYSMLSSYNFDDSDSSIDYFHTNFYITLQIGKWNRPFEVVEKTARINSSKETKAKRITA